MSLENLDFKEDLDVLFEAVLKLQNIDECYKFLKEEK